MSFKDIGPGAIDKGQFNVVIEIPSHSQPVKYEVDKDSGALFVDRFISTAMHYPCNYGYIPKTLSDDGDPVDVLVLTPVPLISGSVIPARPVGMLQMTDEAGSDAKILAVPIDKLCQRYVNIHEPKDVHPDLLQAIEHFFAHYKDLEQGKWVKIDGWVGKAEAEAEVKSSITRYAETENDLVT